MHQAPGGGDSGKSACGEEGLGLLHMDNPCRPTGNRWWMESSYAVVDLGDGGFDSQASCEPFGWIMATCAVKCQKVSFQHFYQDTRNRSLLGAGRLVCPFTGRGQAEGPCLRKFLAFEKCQGRQAGWEVEVVCQWGMKVAYFSLCVAV